MPSQNTSTIPPIWGKLQRGQEGGTLCGALLLLQKLVMYSTVSFQLCLSTTSITTGTVEERATNALAMCWQELSNLTILEYMREVGPGYIFLTKNKMDTEVQRESTTVLHSPDGIFPASMKNPAGHDIQGSKVENDDVEWLGLEHLSPTEYKRHFSHIILKDMDLTNVEGLSVAEAKRVLRPAFAFEQMCQYQTIIKASET